MSKLKSVYHVHLTAPTHPNRGWEQGFIQNGYNYRQVDYMQYAKTWGEKPVMVKILGEVENMKPDFVFMQLQSGQIFNTEFIQKLKKITKVVIFDEDVRHDNVFWMDKLGADLYLISNLDDAVDLMDKGRAADWMLPTFDEELYKKIPLYKKAYEMYGEIIFIGNMYSKSPLNFPNAQQREDMVEFMEQQFGHRFQAYGLGTRNGYLPPHKEAEAYTNCRIAIGHNNFHRTDYQSDRTLRAIASGALFVPQFQKVSRISNLWMQNGSWKHFSQLATIVDEYLTKDKVESEMRNVQQTEISKHSPKEGVVQLQNLIDLHLYERIHED